jgi:uncharacterized protein (TIGR02453 family)
MAVAAPTFEGFRPEAIQFLADLAANNDRAWFQPRKTDYERLLKEPLEALVSTLADRFAARGLPLRADPKRSIFRIYRDTRFAKDKSPYKTNVGASFPWLEDGREGEALDPHSHGNGGYFHFQPGEMFVGGGMYMPDRERLAEWRRKVVEEPEEVHRAIEDPGFTAVFDHVNAHDPLKRVPAGFPADHPDADLLKMRDVVFGRRLSDEEALSPGLADVIADAYAAALPVFRLLASLRS